MATESFRLVLMVTFITTRCICSHDGASCGLYYGSFSLLFLCVPSPVASVITSSLSSPPRYPSGDCLVTVRSHGCCDWIQTEGFGTFGGPRTHCATLWAQWKCTLRAARHRWPSASVILSGKYCSRRCHLGQRRRRRGEVCVGNVSCIGEKTVTVCPHSSSTLHYSLILFLSSVPTNCRWSRCLSNSQPLFPLAFPSTPFNTSQIYFIWSRTLIHANE